MPVTPDQVQQVPALFGNGGLLAPWLTGFAGSVMVYFRVLHMDTSRSLAILVSLKALPIMLLIVVCFQLTAHQREFSSSFPDRYAYRIGGGLLFSAVGDVFLEAEAELGHKSLFLLGLVSFLIGHLAYITAFSIGLRRSDVQPLALLCMATYAIGVFSYLQPTLPTELLVPVLVYAVVIATMATLALSRTVPPPPASFKFRFSKYSGVVGALVFIVSDTILAVNKFSFPVPMGKDLIMVTYYVGQLGITLSTWGARDPPPARELDAKEKDTRPSPAAAAKTDAGGSTKKKKTRKAD